MHHIVEARVTLADYLELPHDGKCYEVLDGELMMSPAPGYRHQRAVTNLLFSLERWRRERKETGIFLTAPFDVVLTEDTILQPDLVYIRSDRLGSLVQGRFHGTPDVVVEIFHAPGARMDRVAKLQIYARYGVPEYWLVDLDEQCVTILVREGTSFRTHAMETAQGTVTSPSLPDLSLAVRDIFAGA